MLAMGGCNDTQTNPINPDRQTKSDPRILVLIVQILVNIFSNFNIAMGNILSYFVPQPAPINQVVKAADVATRKEATEVPVNPVAEDIGVIDDAKLDDMVSTK